MNDGLQILYTCQTCQPPVVMGSYYATCAHYLAVHDFDMFTRTTPDDIQRSFPFERHLWAEHFAQD